MAESYQFRHTYAFKRGVKPEVAAAEIERLAATTDLTASAILDAARPPDAILHPCFEWSDDVAAEQYRLIQARQLIRAIVIVQTANDGTVTGTDSVYVHVPDEEKHEGRYVTLASIADNSDEFERALTELQRKFEAAERAMLEVRRQAQGRGDRTEALAIAIQGFATVQAAIALLR